MKSKQVKKILSITIASAVIVGSTPTAPLIVSAEGQEQDEKKATATPEAPKEEQKPAETPTEAPKPAEQPKEESKPAEQPKEETKQEETSKKEQAPSETPAEQPKKTPKQDKKQTEQSGKTEKAKTQSAEQPTEAEKKEIKEAAASKEISVSWPGTKEVTWDGTAHSVAATAEAGITLTYTVKKDGVEIASGVAEPKVTEPGNYTIVAGSTDNKITISNPATNFTITKAKIQAFTWNGLKPQYNEGKAVEVPTASFTSADKKAPGEISVNVAYKDSGEKNYAAGDKYEVYVSLTDEQKAHYEITGNATAIQEIQKKEIEAEWTGTDNLVYNGQAQETAKCTSPDYAGEIKVSYSEKPVDAGDYTATATVSDPNYTIKNATKEFKIEKCKVTVTAEDTTKVYGEKNPFFKYTVAAENADLTGEAETLLKNQETKEESILTCDGVNVDTYDIKLKEGVVLDNFKIDYKPATLEITRLYVTVVPKEGQYKYYGAKPEYCEFDVQISDKNYKGEITADIAYSELQENGSVLKLTEKNSIETPAGTYGYILAHPENDYGNYYVTLGENEEVYTVKALPVTVIPDSEQHKTYGEEDRLPYTYKIDYDKSITTLTEEDITGELEKEQELLGREEGETPGTYKYNLRSLNDNYELELKDGEFTIDPVQITEVQAINSRQDSFEVKTNIDAEARKEDVVTRIKVEAKFPDSKEISFSKDIETYINSASGISFDGAETTVKVQDATYAKARKDSKKSLEWLGKLPAGTRVNVSIVDADGNAVSEEVKSVTVAKVGVSLNGWGGTTAGATGNYVVANGGKAAPLTLTGSHANEYVEILYSKTKGGAAEASYARMNTSFTPAVNNSGSTHVMQYITAGIVDTLNLTCNAVDQTFYVDDQAFPIESSAIQFENRGKEIKIRLPEVGTITNVSIPGAKVEPSGTQGQEFTLKADWSGKKLIPTGTAISVTYKDQAGHEGSGTGTATRSSVSTPITFRIRPELNVNGYLNGQSNTLIVSGAACSCEPIRVTVAGMSQTVNATQVDTWTDSNGSWEVMFDMNSLPEKQDFTISAEYMDVNGASYSINAKYEAFVSPADIKSPIYEAMTHISGMVEPGTAVALVINGDKKKYQEIEVDRFGRLSMDDVPMLFGGEDSFDIYVQDIAGNVSISHYEIPEEKDPSEVTSGVNPLGKYIFQGDKEKASSYAATPISGKDFTDSQNTLELPLIMGMSYEVGKMTVKKSGNGIVISSAVDANGIDKEDYSIKNEHMYVYRSKPSAADIEKQTGKEYAYGEEIPLGANDTIWIVDNKDMTILTESIKELELFNYKESKEYEKYQEQ